MKSEEIIADLPYTEPFLFVDELLEIDENGSKGTFTFLKNMDFYQGHFKDNPVTPGVILIECCAQIGVVCLGVYLTANDKKESSKKKEQTSEQNIQIGLSSLQMEFLLPVFPGEKVMVISQKIYFRFGKLKCAVKMYNARRELVCKGEIAGMIKTNGHG